MERNTTRSSSASRRQFLVRAGALASMSLLPLTGLEAQASTHRRKPAAPAGSGGPIRVKRVNANWERHALIRPYGFKGGSVSEGFHSIVLLESDSGIQKVGLGKQSVLWSDENVAHVHTEAGGNALMFAVTEYALQLLQGQSYTTPIQLLDDLFPDVYAYAKRITGNDNLRHVFVLNALVPVDNAAWLLYAAENGIETFDEMIPAEYRAPISHRNPAVASLPSLSYGTPIEEVKQLVDEGFFFMKFKIGQPGSEAEMLEKDKARIEAIHKAIGHVETPHTRNGKIPYYLDANGRYQKKESVQRLIDHMDKIGALDQVVIIEDPLVFENKEPVHDLGVTIAVDEFAFTPKDAQERIDLGYRAFGLKVIAKTLSMTAQVAKVAHDNDVPCYCADLTAYPALLEWNKSFVARLAPFPGLGITFMEANGHQNYADWQKLISQHPYPDAPWIRPVNGVYELSDEFYKTGGGLFATPPHYYDLVKIKNSHY